MKGRVVRPFRSSKATACGMEDAISRLDDSEKRS